MTHSPCEAIGSAQLKITTTTTTARLPTLRQDRCIICSSTPDICKPVQRRRHCRHGSRHRQRHEGRGNLHYVSSARKETMREVWRCAVLLARCAPISTIIRDVVDAETCQIVNALTGGTIRSSAPPSAKRNRAPQVAFTDTDERCCSRVAPKLQDSPGSLCRRILKPGSNLSTRNHT